MSDMPENIFLSELNYVATEDPHPGQTSYTLTSIHEAEIADLRAEIQGGDDAFSVVVEDKLELKQKLAELKRNYQSCLKQIGQQAQELRERDKVINLMREGLEDAISKLEVGTWIEKQNKALAAADKIGGE